MFVVVAYIWFRAPLLLLIWLSSSSHALTPVFALTFTEFNKYDIWLYLCTPAIPAIVVALSSSVIFSIASFISINVFFKPINFPCASQIDTPILFRVFTAVLFDTILVSIEFIPTPASSAFVPLLARIPSPVIVSSRSAPTVRAAPPVFIKACMSCSAVVLE